MSPAPKPLAEALADFRDDLLRRFPEHGQALVSLAEISRGAFETLFSEREPLHPKIIDELCGAIDNYLRDYWQDVPREVVEALNEHRQSIRARLFKGQIKWGEVGPELRDTPPDYFCPFPLGDLPEAMIAGSGLKAARLVREGASVNIVPNTLHAVFTPKENKALDTSIPRHIRKFADMYPLYPSLLRRQKPLSFHVFLTVPRMRRSDGLVVPSTPANIVEIHADRFSDDPVTQTLRKFIIEHHVEGATDLAVNLHCNTFHGDQRKVKDLKMDMEVGIWGDNPKPTVETPTLSRAFQAAIAKTAEPDDKRNFTALTNAEGPDGKFILVFAKPANEGGQIYLRDESVIDDPENDLPIAVTSLIGGTSSDGRTRWHSLPVFIERKVIV